MKDTEKASKNKKVKSYKSAKIVINLQLLALIAPGIILLIIFNYLPMGGVILAFKKFNPNIGMIASEWVGIDNFKFFFTSNDYIRVLRNTILYSLDFLLVTTVANLGLAILFYNITSRKALKFYQTTAILPSFMSTVLISYIVYAFLNPTAGLLNKLLTMLGIEAVDWYGAAPVWPVILNVIKVWSGIGMGSLYYYAAMMNIDESIFEAARVDGANKWQEIRYILIPEMMGLVCMFLILGVGGIMSGDFGLHYQITRNQGILYPTTDILPTYIFRAVQTGSSMGRTAAIGLFGSVTGTILVVITNLIVRKLDPEKSIF